MSSIRSTLFLLFLSFTISAQTLIPGSVSLNPGITRSISAASSSGFIFDDQTTHYQQVDPDSPSPFQYSRTILGYLQIDKVKKT